MNLTQIAESIISVCLDIAKDTASNYATTYLDYYNLMDYTDDTVEELINEIMQDERVLFCTIFEMSNEDITITFTEEAVNEYFLS